MVAAGNDILMPTDGKDRIEVEPHDRSSDMAVVSRVETEGTRVRPLISFSNVVLVAAATGKIGVGHTEVSGKSSSSRMESPSTFIVDPWWDFVLRTDELGVKGVRSGALSSSDLVGEVASRECAGAYASSVAAAPAAREGVDGADFAFPVPPR